MGSIFEISFGTLIEFINADSKYAVEPRFLRKIEVEDARRRIDFVINVDIFIVESQAAGAVAAGSSDDINVGTV